jgi:hypothetical protein
VLFSCTFDIVQPTDQDTWFDPILDHDTPLFIDPFLIFSNPFPPFDKAHGKIVHFFDQAFQLAAKTVSPSGVRYRKLLEMLLFPEVPELCLGYSGPRGTDGSGSGRGFSKVIADGIFESIRAGIIHVEHFEEIGLLHEGIGCDRISDAVANILKRELVDYTRQVCERHNLHPQSLPVRNLNFNTDTLRWESAKAELPRNPYSGHPVLLVPERFLRELPTINPDDFWGYLWDNENERLRDDFGYEVKSHVNKHEIIKIATANLDWVQDYTGYVENRQAQPYDLDQDPGGLYQWHQASLQFVTANPIHLIQPTNLKGFLSALETLVAQYKHYVEQEGGWRLLWNDDQTPKRETAGQLLFHGIVKHYCRANDVDLSREVETGRGPVDFKFSHGYYNRALLEVKLANNSRFWNGILRQTPTYLDAAEVSHGFVVVIAHSQRDFDRLGDIHEAIRARNERLSWHIRPIIVDATPKPSASKL